MSAIKYMFEVIICSGLFLVCYRWMIARKTSFRLCRLFIMTSMMLSVAIPALNIPLYRFETEADIPAWMSDVYETDTEVMTAEEAGAEETGVNAGQDAAADGAIETAGAAAMNMSERPLRRIRAGHIIGIIYLAAVLASIALLVYNFVRIRNIKRKATLTYTKAYTLAEHEDIKTPFSFLRTIFMGFNYEPVERTQILAHEASHVRHGHSFERLTLSVIRSIFWFNPFFRMAEKDLTEVQEWEADKDVLEQGHELNSYRLTIFKQLFGYNPDISCGLNHSLTKQRFIMMTQSHRGKGAWIRLAATLPVIAAVFLAFGCGAKSSQKEYADNQAGTSLTDTTAIHLSMPCDPIGFMDTHGSGRAQSRFSRKHAGVDFVLNEGDPIWAAEDGTLVSIKCGDEEIITYDEAKGNLTFVQPENASITTDSWGEMQLGDAHMTFKDKTCEVRCKPDGQGLTLTLRHEDGLETVYRQLPQITFTDHIVKVGQLIGKAGMTARSTGVHLHFEVHKDGEPVDPMPYLNSPASTAKAVFVDIVKAGEDENRISDTYHVTVDGEICSKDKIAETIARKMATDSNIKVVQLSADPQTPMGIIIDIKEQLRKIDTVKLMFVSEAGAMQSLADADTTHVYNPRYGMKEICFGTELSNIIHMKINAQDRYLIGSRPGYLNDETMVRLKSYIAEVPQPDQGMVLFQYDRGTSYKGYYEARSFVDRAYYELWDELAADMFGRPYTKLSNAEMKTIHNAIPKKVLMFDMKATRHPIAVK